MTERDSKGKFLKGHKKIGGRGLRKEVTLENLGDMFLETISRKGGQKFLDKLADDDPKGFTKAMTAFLDARIVQDRMKREVEGEIIPINFVRNVSGELLRMVEDGVRILESSEINLDASENSELGTWVDRAKGKIEEEKEKGEREEVEKESEDLAD